MPLKKQPPRTENIRTLQDIANAVTPENIDNFIKDFEGVLKTYLIMVTFMKARMDFEPDGLKNTDLVEFHGLYWTDDGKHDITCKIIDK